MEQEIVVFANAFGFEKLTVGSAATPLTATEYKLQLPTPRTAKAALVTADGTAGTNDVRWTVDGTAPTSTVGHLLKAGQTLVIRGYGNLCTFQAIRTNSDGTLQITYFGG